MGKTAIVGDVAQMLMEEKPPRESETPITRITKGV